MMKNNICYLIIHRDCFTIKENKVYSVDTCAQTATVMDIRIAIVIFFFAYLHQLHVVYFNYT